MHCPVCLHQVLENGVNLERIQKIPVSDLSERKCNKKTIEKLLWKILSDSYYYLKYLKGVEYQVFSGAGVALLCPIKYKL